MHVVTKPSFWADVESNPREIVVRADWMIQTRHVSPFTEIFRSDSDYNSDDHGIEFISTGSNSKICAYEIELEDTAADIAECDFACDEFDENGNTDGNDCSRWVDESADKCYFESGHTKSLLRSTDDQSKSNLVQCQSCAEYNLDENIVTDADLNKKCLGSGVYYEYDSGSTTSQRKYHPISAQADGTYFIDYI